MRIIENSLPADGVMSAVSIGDFDGVHIGHAAILETLKSTAAKMNLKSVVYTFDRCTKGFGSICSLDKRLKLLERHGVNYVCIAKFDDIRSMSAENFAENILKQKLGAAAVVGCDIRFGFGARGDESLLKKHGIGVVKAKPVSLGGGECSSTRIRSLLQSGDIASANRLLGWKYSIDGEVKVGHRNGRKLGFPTANQHFESGLIVPAFGVYAATVLVENKKYGGICNIGVHPTLGAELVPVAETHIFDFDGDIYGKNISVSPVKFIRREIKFNDISSLCAQVARDIDEAKLTLLSEDII